LNQPVAANLGRRVNSTELSPEFSNNLTRNWPLFYQPVGEFAAQFSKTFFPCELQPDNQFD